MADVITSDPIIHGTSGDDMLYGTGAASGGQTYYGGAGNDSFVISLASLQAAASTTGKSYNGTIAADAAILDFGGAGGWSATNNDFLALVGFSAGSSITFDHYGKPGGVTDVTTQFYTIHDAASNTDYSIYIHSTDGKILSKATGDLNFY